MVTISSNEHHIYACIFQELVLRKLQTPTEGLSVYQGITNRFLPLNYHKPQINKPLALRIYFYQKEASDKDPKQCLEFSLKITILCPDYLSSFCNLLLSTGIEADCGASGCLSMCSSLGGLTGTENFSYSSRGYKIQAEMGTVMCKVRLSEMSKNFRFVS